MCRRRCAGDITRQLRRMHRNIAHERKKPVAVHPPVVLSKLEKSMLRPSNRGGVPVFSRPTGKFNSLNRAANAVADGQPTRPPVLCLSPMWMTPAKKVPTQKCHRSGVKCRSLGRGKHRVFARHEQAGHQWNVVKINRLSAAVKRRRTAALYKMRSLWVRVARTAGAATGV